MKAHQKMTDKLNQAGQVTIEAVIIMIVLVGIFGFVTKTLESEKFLASMIRSPWGSLVGMIENGVWGAQTLDLHPNHHERHISFEGEQTQ